MGIYDVLPVGGIRLLGVDIVVKPRCALADKGCKMLDFLSPLHVRFYPAYHRVRLLDSRALGHPYVDHELVALCRRKKLLRHYSEEDYPHRDGACPQNHGRDLMAHEQGDNRPVAGLEEVQEIELLLT